MVVTKGMSLLLFPLLFAWVNADCEMDTEITVGRQLEVSLPPECPYFTLTVTSATSTKMTVVTKSGTLGPNGRCQVNYVEAGPPIHIADMVGDGRNNGIIYQPPSTFDANLLMNCFLDGSPGVTYKFETVDDVEFVDLGSILDGPSAAVANYPPNKLYHWMVSNVDEDIGAFVDFLESNIPGDTVLAFTDLLSQLPVDGPGAISSNRLLGMEVHMQFLTSGSPSSSNALNFTVSTDPDCRTDSHFTRVVFSYDANCPTRQFYFTHSQDVYFVLGLLPPVPSLECDFYVDGVLSNSFGGTVFFNSFTGSFGRKGFFNCRTPTSFSSAKIYVAEYDINTACFENVPLEQDEVRTITTPSIGDTGDVSPQLFCTWPVTSPYLYGGARMQIPSLSTPGIGFLQVSNGINPTLFLTGTDEVSVQSVLASTGQSIVLFYQDDIPGYPAFNVTFTATCYKYCLDRIDSTDRNIMLTWTDHTLVDETILLLGGDTLSYHYPHGNQACFANLSPNTLYNLSIIGEKTTEIANFQEQIITAPGQMTEPWVAPESIDASSATVHWDAYAVGDNIVSMYQLKWYAITRNGVALTMRHAPAQGLSGMIDRLEPNMLHTVSVRAVTDAGFGRFSHGFLFTAGPSGHPNLRQTDCLSVTSIQVDFDDVPNDGEGRTLVRSEICWCYTLENVFTDNLVPDYVIENLLPNRRVIAFTKAYFDDGLVAESPHTILQPKPRPFMNSPTLLLVGMTMARVTWEPYQEGGDIEIVMYILTVEHVNGTLVQQHMVDLSLTSFFLNNLVPNTEYNVFIQASHEDCNSDMSPPLLVTTDPGPARNVQVIDHGADTLTIQWDEPESGDARAIMQYSLNWNSSAGNGSVLTDQLSESAVGLTGNTPYVVYVVILYDDGATTESPRIHTGTVPSPPTLLSISTQATSLHVTYNVGGILPIIRYLVNDSGEIHTTSNTELNIMQLVPNTMYVLEVFAENMFGQSLPSTGSAVTKAPQPDFTITPGISELSLSFRLPSHGNFYSVTWGVELEKQTGSESGQTFSLPDESLLISALTPNSYYNITLEAMFSSGETKTVSKVALTAPFYSNGVVLVDADVSSLTLTWNAFTGPGDADVTLDLFFNNELHTSNIPFSPIHIVANNLDSNTEYQNIFIRITNDAGFTNAVTSAYKTDPDPPGNLHVNVALPNSAELVWDAPSGNAYSVTEYEYQWLMNSDTTPDETASIANLDPGTNYPVTLLAKFGGEFTTSATTNICTAPPEPGNLMGSTMGETVTLTWSQPSSCNLISFYRVNGEMVVGTSTTVQQTFNTISFHEVVAVDQGGGEGLGASIRILTLPDNPSFEVDASIDSVEVTITYPSKDGDAYDFINYLVSVDGGADVVKTTEVFTISGLQGATEYSIVVKAVFTDLSQTFSATKQVTTDPDLVTVVNFETGTHSFNMTWEQPAGGNSIASYDILKDVVLVGSVGSSRFFGLSELQPNTEQNLNIQAINTVGAISDAVFFVATDPLPITTYTAVTCESSTVDLIWDVPVQGSYRDNITDITICTSVQCTTTTDLMYSAPDDTLVNITAQYSLGNSEGSPTTVTSSIMIYGSPSPPTGFQVIGHYYDNMVVSWTPPSGGLGVDKYEILYGYMMDVKETWTVFGGTSDEDSIPFVRSNTLYELSMRGVNACNGTFTPVIRHATAQKPVSDVSQTSATTDTITIEITEPMQDGSARTRNAFVLYINGVVYATIDVTTYTLDNLTSNTEYDIIVESVFVDPNGTLPDTSVQSMPYSICTVPAAPTDPLIQANGIFRWNQPVGGEHIETYEVECSDNIYATSDPYTATHPDTGIDVSFSFGTDNNEYTCRVKATNREGSSEFTADAYFTTEPATPQVGFTSSTPDSITIFIDHNSGGGVQTPQSYQIQATDSSQTYTGSASSTDGTVTGLPSATEFSVVVEAIYASFSLISQPVVMYTVSNGVDVTSLTSTRNTVTISWALPVNDGSEILGYRARLSTDVQGDLETISSSPSTVTGLSSNNAYTVFLFAENQAGLSPEGITMTVITEPSDPTLTVVSVQIDSFDVEYDWNDNGGYNGYSATTYIIVATDMIGNTIATSSIPAATTTETIAGLTAATSYELMQSLELSSSLGSRSVHSNLVNVVTLPDVPVGLTLVAVTESSITISWGMPNGGTEIDDYEIEATAVTNVVFGNNAGSMVTVGLSVTVSDLAPNTRLQVQVNARNSGGSGQAVALDATTLPIASTPPTTDRSTPEMIIFQWEPVVNEGRTPDNYTLFLLDAYGLMLNSIVVEASMQLRTSLNFLSPSTRYNAFVRSSFGGGPILDSETSPHWTNPVQPSPVRLVSSSTDEITVTFMSVSGAFPCCGIESYTITMEGPENDMAILPVEREHTFSVSPNSVYTFTVEAFNGHTTSLPSDAQQISSAPPPVQPQLSSVTAQSISFHWDPIPAGDSPVDRYEVTLSPYPSTSTGQFIAASPFMTFTQLEANREYTVSVRPVLEPFDSPVKGEAMVTRIFTAPLAPAAPVQSPRHPPTATEISVEFACPMQRGCGAITHYDIMWNKTSGNSSDLGSVTRRGLMEDCTGRYTVTGLQINTVYAIQVAVHNVHGVSEFSDPVEICTNPHMPDPPTVAFDLERQGVVVEWLPPPEGGGAEIVEYNVAWFSTHDRGERLVRVIGMNHTTVIQGLLPITNYRVTVQAINAHGAGAPSQHSNITTGSGIICSETPSIHITAEDIATMINPSAGDQLVISSRRVRDQLAAEELLPSCRKFIESNDIEFYFNLTDCEPRVEYASDKFDGEDNDTLLYTFMVQLARQTNFGMIVQRFDETTIFKFKCAFQRSALLTSVVNPFIRKNLFAMDPEHATFDLDFDLYTSLSYNNRLTGSPPRIEVLTNIYVQLRMNVMSNNFVVQLHHCWATPSSSSEDPRSYPIIVHSCPSRNPYDPIDAIQMTRNYMPGVAQFHFPAFVWSNIPDQNQTMYIHCDMVVCDTNMDLTCMDLNCGNDRFRRSLVGNGKQRMSYGPIMLSNREHSLCFEDNGGCEDVCSEKNKVVHCSCKDGRELNADGRTCSAQYHTVVMERDIFSQPLLVIVVVALVVAVFWLSCFQKRSK